MGSSNHEDELSAEIARLHELLQAAAADARTAADNAAAEAETARQKAAATAIRHARELADERARTTAARADTLRDAEKAAAAAETDRASAAAAKIQYARELSDERARTAIARADADEMQHRIKNAFATVQAIANATLRRDVPIDDARAAFNSRLVALARVQDLLFDRSWSDATLRSLVGTVVMPQLGSSSSRLRARGPDIDIGPKTALVFGLALNELTINAFKYGALSNSTGYVELAWTQKTNFVFRWHERDGPPVPVPSRTGFGSRLIRDSLAAQLKGTVEVEFKSRGLIYTVHAPASGLSV